jgi:hydroxypyruvate isomerase
VTLPGLDREAQRECLVQNLAAAAPLAADAGVLLTVEPLNPVDNPGYFLTSSREGLELVGRVGHANVKFQFDTYHLQRMEGNLTSTLVSNIDLIGHIQFADVPGRHEPGTGELNFAHLVAAAEAAGYQGCIGLEYQPLSPGAAALAWVPPERR